MAIDRRKFLGGVAGACGAMAASSVAGLNPAKLFARSVSDEMTDFLSPEQSGIEHIVVVTMENRSFDHFFGWMRWANGKQAGLQYRDPGGIVHKTYPLAPDYTGCPHPDPDHSYSGGRIQYDNGLMDGFLLDTANDVFYWLLHCLRHSFLCGFGEELHNSQRILSVHPWPDISEPDIPARGADRPTR